LRSSRDASTSRGRSRFLSAIQSATVLVRCMAWSPQVITLRGSLLRYRNDCRAFKRTQATDLEDHSTAGLE
jgi:hypothetical protein